MRPQIEWTASRDGYTSSRDGRFDICPEPMGTSRAQGYRLDDKFGRSTSADSQKQCKAEAEARLRAETIEREDLTRILRWLNEIDEKEDELYNIARKAGAKPFEASHPAHRIAGCSLAIRHVIEKACRFEMNTTMPGRANCPAPKER